MPREVVIGGLARADLMSALATAGVRLNPSAEILLASNVFESTTTESVRLAEHSVADLGLAQGGSLSQILAAASAKGLELCPLTVAPYLRLAFVDQESAPDSIMTNGRAPSGSLTVASAPPSADDAYPKGFYLRVIDQVPWLRGYSCTDEHIWSPDDRLVFKGAT